MKFCLLLLSAIILFHGPDEAWAKKKKKKKKKAQEAAKVVEHDYFPCLSEGGEVLNPDFLKSFAQITNDSLTCDEGMDPRWKARLYVTQMKKLMQDMDVIINGAAGDYVDSKQTEDHILLAKEVKELKTPPNPLLDYTIQAVGKLEESNPQLKSTKTGLEVLKVSIDILKKSGRTHESERDHADAKNGFKTIKSMRRDLVGWSQEAAHSFEDIELALKEGRLDPTDTELSPENQEIYRHIVCRFMPQDGKRSKFCSSEHGGEDYNHLRSTSNCDEVNAISDRNRPDEKRRLEAQFARSIAETGKMKDPTTGSNSPAVMPDGMTSHFEIVFSHKENGDTIENTYEALKFNSPGGIEVLCSMLRDPRYDKYRGKNNRLNGKLKISDLNLPVNYVLKNRGASVKFIAWTITEDVDTFKYYTDAKGRVQRYQMNHYESSGNTSRAQEFVKKFKNLKNLSVSQVVGQECDDD